MVSGFTSEFLAAPPAVYAVGKNYHILLVPKSRSVMWCRVGETEYYDDVNGVLRSETRVHKIIVPASELDRAGSYTVGFRRFKERVPYFNQADLTGETTFVFRPVVSPSPRFFLISDVHNRIEAGLAAAKSFRDMDFLIVNGDIHDNSETPEQLLTDTLMAGEITGGEIPAVFSRGNHDLRGAWAERQAEFTPTDNGKSFYTFRLGPVWGVVLDCGEDKADESREYGGVNCCHAFRERETAFLREIASRAGEEYAAPGVEYRLVLSHINFSEPHKPPFDIEYDIYGEWCRLLREHVRPDCYLYGHVHRNYVTMPGSERDIFNQGAPAVAAGVPAPKATPGFTGCGLTLSKGSIGVRFINQAGEIPEELEIERPGCRKQAGK